jgi:hypothetical protein
MPGARPGMTLKGCATSDVMPAFVAGFYAEPNRQIMVVGAG